MEHLTQNATVKSSFSLLKATFIVLPIAAGADKFTHLLTNWDQYLNPALADLLPIPAPLFMKIVGVIEIIAGIIVLFRPRLGGFIVAAWLFAIALTLLAGGMFLDVAVRDIVIAIAAVSMARLARTAA